MKRKAPDLKGRPIKRQQTKKPPRKKSVGVGIGQELKFHDVSFTTDATTTGVVVALNHMAAGDTALLRDGNKIRMKSIQLKWTSQLESIAANAVCRFMIVYDRQPNGVAPTIATATTGPLESISVVSMRQVASSTRFKVLYDHVFALNNTSDTAGAFQIRNDECFIKIPEEAQFASFVDGNAGAPQTGGLYLMYMSTLAAGASDVDIEGRARLRFWG